VAGSEVTTKWWGEAPEGTERCSEAFDVHLAIGMVRPKNAPSSGLSLGHGSERLQSRCSADFLVSSFGSLGSLASTNHACQASRQMNNQT
jgi:hypothetical protein